MTGRTTTMRSYWKSGTSTVNRSSFWFGSAAVNISDARWRLRGLIDAKASALSKSLRPVPPRQKLVHVPTYFCCCFWPFVPGFRGLVASSHRKRSCTPFSHHQRKSLSRDRVLLQEMVVTLTFVKQRTVSMRLVDWRWIFSSDCKSSRLIGPDGPLMLSTQHERASQ